MTFNNCVKLAIVGLALSGLSACATYSAYDNNSGYSNGYTSVNNGYSYAPPAIDIVQPAVVGVVTQPVIVQAVAPNRYYYTQDRYNRERFEREKYEHEKYEHEKYEHERHERENHAREKYARDMQLQKDYAQEKYHREHNPNDWADHRNAARTNQHGLFPQQGQDQNRTPNPQTQAQAQSQLPPRQHRDGIFRYVQRPLPSVTMVKCTVQNQSNCQK